MVDYRLGESCSLLVDFRTQKTPLNSKKRHKYWFYAHQECARFYTDYREISLTVNKLMSWSRAYHRDVSSKIIALQKGDKVLVLPYVTRFDDIYLKRVRRKFHKVVKVTKHLKGRHTFLTVTFDPKKTCTLVSMRQIFAKGVSDLIDRIKKRYHFSCYIRGFEFTKSGLIHAHILFLNIPYIDPGWLSKQLHSCNLGKIKRIREFKGDTKPAILYFFKYLRKSLNSDKFLALSWALNIRTYSWSYIVNVYLSGHKTNFENLGHGWLYLGSFYYQGDVYGVITYDDFVRWYPIYS